VGGSHERAEAAACEAEPDQRGDGAKRVFGGDRAEDMVMLPRSFSPPQVRGMESGVQPGARSYMGAVDWFICPFGFIPVSLDITRL